MLANSVTAIQVRGLRSHQIADRAEIKESRFSKGLNGRLMFSNEEQNRIARVLGARKDWLSVRDVEIPSSEENGDSPQTELTLAEDILACWKHDPALLGEFGDMSRYASFREAVAAGLTPPREPGESKG